MLCAFWEFSGIGDARYEGGSVRVRVLVGCGSATGGWMESQRRVDMYETCGYAEGGSDGKRVSVLVAAKGMCVGAFSLRCS